MESGKDQPTDHPTGALSLMMMHSNWIGKKTYKGRSGSCGAELHFLEIIIINGQLAFLSGFKMDP